MKSIANRRFSDYYPEGTQEFEKLKEKLVPKNIPITIGFVDKKSNRRV